MRTSAVMVDCEMAIKAEQFAVFSATISQSFYHALHVIAMFLAFVLTVAVAVLEGKELICICAATFAFTTIQRNNSEPQFLPFSLCPCDSCGGCFLRGSSRRFWQYTLLASNSNLVCAATFQSLLTLLRRLILSLSLFLCQLRYAKALGLCELQFPNMRVPFFFGHIGAIFSFFHVVIISRLGYESQRPAALAWCDAVCGEEARKYLALLEERRQAA